MSSEWINFYSSDQFAWIQLIQQATFGNNPYAKPLAQTHETKNFNINYIQMWNFSFILAYLTTPVAFSYFILLFLWNNISRIIYK